MPNLTSPEVPLLYVQTVATRLDRVRWTVALALAALQQEGGRTPIENAVVKALLEVDGDLLWLSEALPSEVSKMEAPSEDDREILAFLNHAEGR